MRMSRVVLVVKYLNYYGCAIFYSAYNNYSAIEYATIVALRAKYEFSKVIIILKINYSRDDARFGSRCDRIIDPCGISGCYSPR